MDFFNKKSFKNHVFSVKECTVVLKTLDSDSAGIWSFASR